MMKPSRYICLHRDGERCSLWCLTSGAFVRIPEDEYLALSDGCLPSSDPARLAKYASIGALWEREEDEAEAYLRRAAEREELASPIFRVLVTTACNARCPYCYEKGIPVRTMGSATALHTADTIERAVARSGNSVRIEWFGGEPLLNVPAISCISDRLGERGVRFRSELYTNGLLLHPALAETAAELWRLQSAQITLDGCAEEHERIKGLPAGSFAGILDGIGCLLDVGVRVRVRINYGGDRESTLRLGETLAARFGGRSGFQAYLNALYSSGKETDRGDMLALLSVQEELASFGLLHPRRYDFPARYSRCYACGGSSATVAPDGGLFSCSHLTDEAHRIGTVSDGAEVPLRPDEFKTGGLSEECRLCRFLPICFGGCRAGELGIAEMKHCFPYKSVMDRLSALKMPTAYEL